MKCEKCGRRLGQFDERPELETDRPLCNECREGGK